MIKTLIPENHSLLHNPVKKCSYNLDRSKLSYTLTENMFHYNGVGLSANQIGINERVFIMVKDLEYNEILTCFNPRILKQSSKTCIMEEGCLSYPKLFLEISRPSSIIVRYEDEGKTLIKRRLEGFIGRIFQHEYDHMEGIDFTQRS